MSRSLPDEAPGHVILLNGTPSSGKTAIARALWSELRPEHWYSSLDDFRRGYQINHWRSDPRPLFQLTFRGFIRSVATMANAGHDVITEAIILPDSDPYQIPRREVLARRVQLRAVSGALKRGLRLGSLLC